MRKLQHDRPIGRSPILFLFAVIPLMSLWFGCTGGPLSVEGQVTLDGQPLENGSITFEAADGKGPTVGAAIESGRYRISGDAPLEAGPKCVRIQAMRKSGRRVPAGPPGPPDAMIDEVQPCIPAVYNTKSTLTCEISPQGPNRHDFRLTSKATTAGLP